MTKTPRRRDRVRIGGLAAATLLTLLAARAAAQPQLPHYGRADRIRTVDPEGHRMLH